MQERWQSAAKAVQRGSVFLNQRAFDAEPTWLRNWVLWEYIGMKVSAPQSMRQMQTALPKCGSNHLGFVLAA